MGRPIYSYELEDPDFAWLISNFKENNPHSTIVETSCLPVVFIGTGKKDEVEEKPTLIPLLPPRETTPNSPGGVEK